MRPLPPGRPPRATAAWTEQHALGQGNGTEPLYGRADEQPRLQGSEQHAELRPLRFAERARPHAGERVTVEPVGDGELRIRRTSTTFENAFGTLTGVYAAGYLERLDAEDEPR